MDSLSVLKNKPEIRFAGFDGNWEQRKCGSFATESCEKGHTGSIAKKLTVKLHANGVCEAGEITQGSDNTQYYVRHAGQFIYGKQNFFNGAIGVVPESLDKYESTKDVPAFDIDKIVDVDWFCHYMTRPEIYKPQELNCTGTGSKRFHVNSFFDMSILAPCLQEQQAIGKTFTNLNHLIILHQRKCDRLQALKKAMLEKMFPKAGSDVPEIRFAGFTDAWEQRKLGDLVDVCSGRDYKHLSEGDIPVYGTGGYMLSVSEALSYDKDAIGIGRKGTIDKPYILNAPFWTVDTLFYAIPREKIDLNFAFDIFQNIDWKKKDESTGVPSLSKAAINEIDVLVPQYDEQQALGEFFNGIDNLITLHQRKLQKLQECKKALLEKMFVG